MTKVSFDKYLRRDFDQHPTDNSFKYFANSCFITKLFSEVLYIHTALVKEMNQLRSFSFRFLYIPLPYFIILSVVTLPHVTILSELVPTFSISLYK